MRNPASYTKLRFIGMSSRRTIEAMFNPPEVAIAHGFAHGSHAIAGRHSPLYGGGAGKQKTVSLALPLDGDRGRMSNRPRFEGISVFNDPAPRGLSIADDIAAYMSMVLPHDLAQDGAYGTPEMWIVQWGTTLNARVLVEDVSQRVTAMLPDGSPMRAEITIDMRIVAMRNVTDWSFLNGKDDSLDNTPNLESLSDNQRR